VISLLARVDSRLPNPQLAATVITADLALPRHLTLTGGYLFADLRQRSQVVHVPLVAVTKSLHIGRLAIAGRNRFEELVRFGTSPVRYRNRLLFDPPIVAHNRWHVFADEQMFFDLSSARWDQNRFQAGGGARLTRRLWFDIYYLQRNLRAGAFETNMLGTTLRVALTPKEDRGMP
jgi:uncharacterized protein DUF2490